jgi:alpha-galactosidase
MPGGTSRALRMIPAMLDIARDTLELAPEALFFNYGNPVPSVCRAIRKATGAPVVGLCHGVIDVARHLAGLLEVPLGELQYTALGLNHLTWFTEVRTGERDLMPRLMAMARERVAAIARGDSVENPFTWELVDLFGAFPAVLDRHVTEFYPHLFAGKGAYYGKTLGMDAFRFEDTIAWGDDQYAQMQELAAGTRVLPPDFLDRIAGEHEQVMAIIESIRRNLGQVFSANLPNRGQIPNLPEDAVVESPAVAYAGGLRPVRQKPLAPGMAGTLAARCQWSETVVEAALAGSRRAFVQALLLDGAVTSIATAGRLAAELLGAQRAHLPQMREG